MPILSSGVVFDVIFSVKDIVKKTRTIHRTVKWVSLEYFASRFLPKAMGGPHFSGC